MKLIKAFRFWLGRCSVAWIAACSFAGLLCQSTDVWRATWTENVSPIMAEMFSRSQCMSLLLNSFCEILEFFFPSLIDCITSRSAYDVKLELSCVAWSGLFLRMPSEGLVAASTLFLCNESWARLKVRLLWFGSRQLPACGEARGFLEGSWPMSIRHNDAPKSYLFESDFPPATKPKVPFILVLFILGSIVSESAFWNT